MWAIWDKAVGDWVREHGQYKVGTKSVPILAYQSKQAACKRAAEFFGFSSYTEAKAKDWCEVRPLK